MSALLALKYLAAMGGGAPKTMIEDVFSTHLYTGNGSTQSIVNGIDLATKGGMTWIKSRTTAANNGIFDTARGANKRLQTDGTAAQTTDTDGLNTFTSTGFTLGAGANEGKTNTSGVNYISHSFRKAPKFFDMVTYTGTGSSQTISHSLNQTVGVLVIKRISGTGNWATFARTGGAAGATQYAYFNSSAGLNLTAAAGATGIGAEAAGFITSTGFKPNDLSGSGGAGNADNINENGSTYVAYLFAHDTSADGLIQCGSYTVDAGGNPFSVNLGCEPQYVLIKSSSGTGGWYIFDNLRGIATGGDDSYLLANTSGAEVSGTVDAVDLTATGFKAGANATVNAPSTTYIYLAIRRGPMRFPTSGTQVYNAIARTGNNAETPVSAGFPVDLAIIKARNAAVFPTWFDRMRGKSVYLDSSGTAAETSRSDMVISFNVDGVTLGADTFYNSVNQSSLTYINHFFRRYPGVFDIVCYTGTSAARTVNHNLGAVPEMMIVKRRDGADRWYVYSASLNADQYLALNETSSPAVFAALWNNTRPTSSVFSLGATGQNGSGLTYIAYLFATLAGISKVGSYAGNGTSQTIDCGFAAGCRFFLVKAASTTGSWWIYDSTRGIVASADNALQLNSTAAETTSADAVDPAASGVIVNQEATCSINANGVSYVFLALA